MPELLTAQQIPQESLNAFLRQVYPPLKAEFLIQHGEWWHGSNSNRLVILVDGQVAGYCGVIPAQVWVAGQVRNALWWVDLVIAPEFRGRGLQSLFDERVKQMSPILLGFPNEVAAKIHRKHGWGVREDMPIDLLPLWPMRVKMVRRGGWKVRLGALALSPLAALWCAWLTIQRPQRAWKLPAFEADTLAGVFERFVPNDLNTTLRSADFLQWRYGQAPHPQEYAFYLAGPCHAPTHFLIARFVTQSDGVRYARILDVFGDFADTPALSDLFTLALQDCIRHRAGQVTLIASRPELHTLARRFGFLFSAPVGFCWLGAAPALMKSLAGQNYWVMADSDNDAPD